jgi:hypothetical protein
MPSRADAKMPGTRFTVEIASKSMTANDRAAARRDIALIFPADIFRPDHNGN